MSKKIEGWVRPAGVEVNGPGYELGSGCGWCEFNECGQPDHGDQKATLVIGEKAFTESEVRAMLVEVRNDYILDEDKEWLTQKAAEHGIVLDPS